MNAFTCRYTLRNGARGVLTLIAESSGDAIIAALDALGEQIQRLSVRAGLVNTTVAERGAA